MRIVVFPGDPLKKYFAKGEVKERYWNPNNIFDEVHVISLCDVDIEPEKVQDFAGKAKLFIHPIGRPNVHNYLGIRQRALECCRQVKPDLIKGHGALVMGYYAAFCGQRLSIPSVVSLHSDHSIIRTLRAAGPSNIPRALYQLCYRISGMEKYALKKASAVVCAYQFPARHALSMGANEVEVIYNKVDIDRFRPIRAIYEKTCKILTVGNHIPGKEPSAILRAMPHIDALLTIVGQGPLTAELNRLTVQLGVSDKVVFIPSIPHKEIHTLYQNHDIFCISIRYPGVCIPVLEAMASGLPVVVNQPIWEELPEFIGQHAVVVENSGPGFAKGLNGLLANERERQCLGSLNRTLVESISSDLMEEKEASLFAKLINGQMAT